MIHSSTEASAIARSRIEGGWKGIYTGALVTVRDTLVRTSSTGTALEALASSTAASVDARHVTVVGPGTGVGALVMTSWDKDATVTLSNSVVSGFSTAGQSLQYYGTGARVVAVYRSVLPPGGPVKYVEETEVLRLADPGFADPAAGDFTLMPGSPALDFAAPMLPGGLAAKDLLGRARPADGDGDGTALPDPGAFERPAPGGGGDAGGGGETGTGGETAPPGGDVVAPAVTGLRVTLGARPRARFALSEPAQVAVTLARRRNGRFRTLTTITRAKAGGEVGVRLPRRLVRRSGRYRVALLATDAAANVSPTARTRFRVR